MADQQRAIGSEEQRRRAVHDRFKRAKDAWTRAAVAAWKGQHGAEQEVAAALAELNAARRALAEFEPVQP